MGYYVEAACGCHMGKVRKTNEDNFLFDERCLERENLGLRHQVTLEQRIKNGVAFAVFDGMGGERFGELAAFAAARKMQSYQRTLWDFYVPEKRYLVRLAMALDDEVVQAQRAMQTENMGTTMVSLHFFGNYAYVCNVGDSRAYRLRQGEFLQLSCDHVQQRPGGNHKKEPLSQYLGYGSQDRLIEPHIAKGRLQAGDVYLLCSDGLTDMLSNFEISHILLTAPDPVGCVEGLVRAALAQGGRDNITAIVCRVKER